jgi:hypothetical protein
MVLLAVVVMVTLGSLQATIPWDTLYKFTTSFAIVALIYHLLNGDGNASYEGGNNDVIIKGLIHVVLATVLAYVVTSGMIQYGLPTIEMIALHGYEFDLGALVGSHLVVAKIFFG